MKEQASKKNYGLIITVTTTILFVGYAIIRYNVFGNIPWKDTPLFVLNKGISLASLVLITFNFCIGPVKHLGLYLSDEWLHSRKLIGIIGFLYALIHVLISFVLLNPNYFPVLFIEEEFSLKGGISLLSGIVSFVLLGFYAINFIIRFKASKLITDIIYSKFFVLLIFLSVGIHIFYLASSGWTTTSTWLGNLPPISLISFVILCIGLFINIIWRK